MANHNQAQGRLDPRMVRLERRLLEAFDELWDNFVDPADAVFDVDGTRWNRIGGDGPAVLGNEPSLAEVRTQCRALAIANEFAINGHENRISYIVGSGHTYRAAAKRDRPADAPLAVEVQAVLDEFTETNRWHSRQQEIVRRKDRDGECFLRLFAAPDGSVRVRFVEPDQVATPAEVAALAHHSLGIITDPHDVESVEGYYIDGLPVDAGEIQHRKLGVDANVKRGLPLFYPVRKNLRRAEKLLRNMSVVAEIQSAIALIRKHVSATAAGVEQFVQDQADMSVTSQTTGQTTHFKRYAPGTILDAMAGTEYEFPVAGINAAGYVVILQAELRAVASRLVMPEFMLTSDASNANYASTMVAEGPAVKMFQRLQHDMIEDDLQIMQRVIGHAVESGRLASDALEAVDVRAVAPTLAVRDRLKDAQADQILLRNGAMSVDTLAMRHGLDPQRERQLIGE